MSSCGSRRLTQRLLSGEHALPTVMAETTPVVPLLRFAAGRRCSGSGCGQCLSFPSDGVTLRFSPMLSRSLRKTMPLFMEAVGGGCCRLSITLSEDFCECWHFLSSVKHDKTFVEAGVGMGSPQLQGCSGWHMDVVFYMLEKRLSSGIFANSHRECGCIFATPPCPGHCMEYTLVISLGCTDKRTPLSLHLTLSLSVSPELGIESRTLCMLGECPYHWPELPL